MTLSDFPTVRGTDGLLVSPPRHTGDGFYEAAVAQGDGTRIEITV